MNCQVDITIIGDSKEGHEVLRKIAGSNLTIKVAFISREFRSRTTHDYLNVEYIKNEVVFTDYKNRLFGCYLSNGDRIYSTYLIIATGLKYEPLMLKHKPVPCVFNNLNDVPKAAKNQPALVIGDRNSDIKLALDVAKKYKHVYLCAKSITFVDDATQTNIKKLLEAENIVVLSNTELLKVTVTDGILQGVELDNYSTMACSAIYIKTKSSPEVAFISDKLIQKDDLGYLVVTDSAESMLVPKCFAIGNCIKKYTKRMSQLVVKAVLDEFNGGTCS